MSTNDNITTNGGCGCGCSTMTKVTNAAEPCGCGCECCGAASVAREDEIAELRRLRDSVDQRLAELQAS